MCRVPYRQFQYSWLIWLIVLFCVGMYKDTKNDGLIKI